MNIESLRKRGYDNFLKVGKDEWFWFEDNNEYECYNFANLLSNGQWLALCIKELYFGRYNLSICIADSLLEAEAFNREVEEIAFEPDFIEAYETDLSDYITGRCGLEGLAKAFRFAKFFVKDILPDGCSVMVIGSDDKRATAYRFLHRIGFENTNESTFVFTKNGELKFQKPNLNKKLNKYINNSQN